MNWNQSNYISSSSQQAVEFSYMLNNNYEMIESYLSIGDNHRIETHKPERKILSERNVKSTRSKCRMETHEWEKLRLDKRNARERNRVRQVNKEFERLRQVLVQSNFFYQLEESEPVNSKTSSDSSLCMDFLMEKENYEDEHKHRDKCKKLSKLRILKLAIDYIQHLSELLQQQFAYSEEESKRYCSYNQTSSNQRDFSFSIKSEENFYYSPCEEQQMDELQRFDLTMRQIKAQMMSNESFDFHQVGLGHFEAADSYHF